MPAAVIKLVQTLQASWLQETPRHPHLQVRLPQSSTCLGCNRMQLLSQRTPGGPAEARGLVAGPPRRERVVAVRGAWMHAASWLVISFFTLSRSIGKIFCTNASSCCLNSSAGYFASTCGQE